MKRTISAVAATLASLYFIIFHWNRFLADFWPLDASRVAPNITAAAVQYVLIGIAMYLLYPPIRRQVDKWIAGHFRTELASLHTKLDLAHQKMDHIIKHHPAIPAFTAESKPSESPATPPPTSPEKS